MNVCTACNSHSNISIKLPRFAPDKKLAFVESVCEELIKDRFGPWYVFESSAARELVAVGECIHAESEPGTRVTRALGHATADDDLYGDRPVPTSPFLTYLRDITSSKPPVTIVPATAPSKLTRAAALGGTSDSSVIGIGIGIRSLFSAILLTLTQPRGSPALNHAF